MKYSIILPYYRRPELALTLESFMQQYKGRNDYEIVIVEDAKNRDCMVDFFTLRFILSQYKNLKIQLLEDTSRAFCPAHRFNMGVAAATGRYVVLSNPEVYHKNDVFAVFDFAFDRHPDSYVVCACKNMRGRKFLSWYQHSVHNNNCYHFCSVMSRQNFERVGGFDERYTGGIGYDDCNFIGRIRRIGMRVFPLDEAMTVHVEHKKEWLKNNDKLVLRNKTIYEHQLSTDTLL
jgi:GT2 family glycosyltransferase